MSDAFWKRLVPCSECEGTGAQEPHCGTCKGYRSVKLKRLYALGYRKSELADVDGTDGFAECPECDGDLCEFCAGDGRTYPEVEESHERRVLMTAKWGYLPPVWVLDYRGRLQPKEYLLSSEAGARLQEQGLVCRLNSVFGHELFLTPKGEKAYEELFRCD